SRPRGTPRRSACAGRRAPDPRDALRPPSDSLSSSPAGCRADRSSAGRGAGRARVASRPSRGGPPRRGGPAPSARGGRRAWRSRCSGARRWTSALVVRVVVDVLVGSGERGLHGLALGRDVGELVEEGLVVGGADGAVADVALHDAHVVGGGGLLLVHGAD